MDAPAESPGAPEPAARRPEVLKKRRDFLAAARGRKHAGESLVLQARRRREDEAPDAVRIGYTCSKKVGGAVVRNRAKRRLRAAVAAILPREGRPGWDYVVIGREGTTISAPFPRLLADLEAGLARVHAEKRPK